MPVYFPSYSNVDMNTIRVALGRYTNPTGPDRYEDGNMARFRDLTGRGYALSDYVGVNFYSVVTMYQGEGYVYDGCQGRDHWCYHSTTAEDGSYAGPFGGPYCYNTERGYNNGNFLTFGYGYAQTTTRPYSGYNIISASSNDYNCRAFYVDILQLYGYNTVAGNYFAYAGGFQYASYDGVNGFQSDQRFLCRLILWY
jgi:hypothetical protein